MEAFFGMARESREKHPVQTQFANPSGPGANIENRQWVC